MTAAEIVTQLESLGTEGYRRVLFDHGVREPVFGVKIEELKKIQKRIKKDYGLALELYDTGIYDAQYLAGLVADPAKMTKKDLRRWIASANCATLCGSTVASVAAESPHGRELALEWIESKDENTAQTGWATLARLVGDLDVPELKRLLRRVEQTIHQQPNNARYTMNGFVIAVGSYVPVLAELAIATGEKVGTVTVNMGNTACRVPYAPDYIRKVQKRGKIEKKRAPVRT
jgi:3-methyladenine DNA glycosylase AlkD